MPNLRETMADFGFESNEDYDYQVRCLLQAPFAGIRCLNIEGDSKRRKTAFATALADALAYPHILYHDCSEQRPPQPDFILPPSKDEMGRQVPPIESLDQRFAEACGFSEAENTVLILDQLQAADFRDHIRIYQFVTSGDWTFRDSTHHANRAHLLLFLISEEAVYHSLQKHSFRIWVSSVSHRFIPYEPQDFGLSEEARPLMEELAGLFQALGMSPTRSEYTQLLHDIHERVRSREGLRHSIYGWTEGVDRSALYAEPLIPQMDRVVEALLGYLGCHEVELTAPPEAP
jgi:hypothetical protein